MSNPDNRGNYVPRLQAKSIASFLNAPGRTIQIPDYQRPYSWGENQRKKLFQDLAEAVNQQEMWFLGPIYTTSSHPQNTTIDLLDGQQRLTTITIILRELYCFRHRHPEFQEFQDTEFLNKWLDLEAKCRQAIINSEFSGAGESKFQTDLSVRGEFSKWIVNGTRIRNNEDYTRLEFRTSESWQLTSKRIKEGINQVAKWLDKIASDSTSENGLEKILRYGEHLLYGLWIIEIPFNQDNDILKVFEAMNNRGLGLSLSDKMRFLIISQSSSENREAIRQYWGNLYKACESFAVSKLFRDIDEFLEVYLSMKAASCKLGDANDENSRDKVIETTIASIGAYSMMMEIILIAKFYQDVFTDGAHTAARELRVLSGRENTGWTSQKIQAIKALSIVGKSVILMSKNMRIFLHYIGSSYDLERTFFITAQELWAAIRIVFQEVVIFNSTSNTVRTKVQQCISKVCDEEDNSAPNLTSLVKLGETGEGWTIGNKKNLFIQNNTDESKASLILFQWFTNKDSLNHPDSGFSSGETMHLEHICPKKWWQHWPNNWADQIQTIKETRSEWWTKLLDDEEDIIPTETGKHKGTLIESIGNKALIPPSTNIRCRNNNWTEKKAALNRDNVILYPNWKIISPLVDAGLITHNNTGDYWRELHTWETATIINNYLSLLQSFEQNWLNQWDA